MFSADGLSRRAKLKTKMLLLNQDSERRKAMRVTDIPQIKKLGEINNDMPQYIVERVSKILNKFPKLKYVLISRKISSALLPHRSLADMDILMSISVY